MKKLILLLLLFSFLFVSSQNTIMIHAANGKVRINKNIYGHFAEHLGRCIYDGFYVGDTDKIIPNTQGVRNDVIAALRKMKIPVLRWPGGCFADTYHWKDGVGPGSKRPSMVNTWWGGVTEDNSFGTHNFLNMCEELGAEPYLSGNVGSGTVQEFSEWLQYVNFDGKSPMSDWRRQNGRDKPWHVEYWGIGNEAWGCGGNMTAEYYANVFRRYATFMTNWIKDGHLYRIASGASDADYHWTEVMMRDVPHNLIDGVGLHHYSIIDWKNKGSATDFTEQQYFDIMKSALQMEELVTKHAAIMDKYDPQKKIALFVDEWGGWYNVEPGTNPGFLFQQNTMRDAMIAGATLNIFNNHADRVRMANLAQTINVLQAVILTSKEKIVLTPTYHVMEMYNVHQNATLLPLKLITDDYKLGNNELPSLSASASKDSSGVIHISITNINAHTQENVTIYIDGMNGNKVTGRILTSEKVQDHNTFENPYKIEPKEFTGASLKNNSINMKIPPFSVVVLTLK
ncbi:MAG: alpha-L-arabinofuranosidase C-terminal domain-containing protein [Ginsengibacter sp.]